MPSERKSSRKPQAESSKTAKQPVVATAAPPEWDENDRALAWARLKRLWHRLGLRLTEAEANCQNPYQAADLRLAFVKQMVSAAGRTYRKVWREGGRTVTPEFIRWVAEDRIRQLVTTERENFGRRLMSPSFPSSVRFVRPAKYPGLAVPLGEIFLQKQEEKRAVWKYFQDNLRSWLADDWGLAIVQEQKEILVRAKATGRAETGPEVTVQPDPPNGRIGLARKLMREFLQAHPEGTAPDFVNWADENAKPVPDDYRTGRGRWSSAWNSQSGLHARLERAYYREKKRLARH